MGASLGTLDGGRRAQSRARAVPVQAAARDRRRAGARRVRRADCPLRLPAGLPAQPLPDAGRVQPHRGGAHRAQPRRDHRPQRRRARAEPLRLHAGDPARARAATSRRRSTSSPTIVEITPRDRRRFRKLLEESKNFESLPMRTKLTDEEVARFAVNRYPLPRRGDQGAAVPPLPVRRAGLALARPHRPHQRHGPREDRRVGGRRPTTAAPTTSARSASSSPTSATCTAPPACEEVEVDAGGRAVRTLSRTPPVSGNNLRLSIDIKLQQVAEAAFGDRRGALVAIDPTTGERARVRQQARLRPEPVRRRHRPGQLEGAERVARQAAAQPSAARRLPAGLDDQAVPGARRA